MYEDRTGHPAPPAGEGGILYRYVVVGYYVVGLYAFGLGELAGHLEVEHVAGVVLDDVEDARAAVDGFGGFEHLVGGGAGEDGAGAGGVEHSGADVAAVGRLVAGAAPGDEGDFALHRSVGAHYYVVLGDHPEEIAVGQLHPPEHLFDHPLRGVDDLLHLFPFRS